MEMYRKAYNEIDCAIAEVENVMWLTNDRRLLRYIEKLQDMKMAILELAAETCRAKVVE